MEQYNLGPNGAIITSLNLYASSFHKVLEIIENRRKKSKYVIFDTPGQIEVFTWSASGTIITECLSRCFPTIILYLADTQKCKNPTTFMSNMTHSVSVLYKYQLPFVLAFNKVILFYFFHTSIKKHQNLYKCPFYIVSKIFI